MDESIFTSERLSSDDSSPTAIPARQWVLQAYFVKSKTQLYMLVGREAIFKSNGLTLSSFLEKKSYSLCPKL